MRPSIVLAVTLALLAAACTADNPPATPDAATSPGAAAATSSPVVAQTPPTEEQPTRAPSAATDSPQGGRPESPFGRRDTPEGGVSALLEAVPGIAGPCDVNPPEDLPGLAIHTTILPSSLCGLGFEPSEPVQLVLAGPGGREWTAQVRPNDAGFFEWQFERMPRRVLGQYRAEARQGETEVSGTFNVAVEYLQVVVVPRYFAPGQSTELILAGGPAGGSVAAHLYKQRAAEDGWDYITDLGPIRLNADGQARLELSSRRRDEEGRYVVAVELDGGNEFFWFVLER